MKHQSGLTLTEVTVVILIMGLFVGLAVLGVNSFRVRTHVNMCHSNRVTVMRYYEAYQTKASVEVQDEDDLVIITDEEIPLGAPVIDHEKRFKLFFLDHFEKGCPRGGVYEWRDDQVWCDVCGNYVAK